MARLVIVSGLKNLTELVGTHDQDGRELNTQHSPEKLSSFEGTIRDSICVSLSPCFWRVTALAYALVMVELQRKEVGQRQVHCTSTAFTTGFFHHTCMRSGDA